jgi:hypothetical protein
VFHLLLFFTPWYLCLPITSYIHGLCINCIWVFVVFFTLFLIADSILKIKLMLIWGWKWERSENLRREYIYIMTSIIFWCVTVLLWWYLLPLNCIVQIVLNLVRASASWLRLQIVPAKEKRNDSFSRVHETNWKKKELWELICVLLILWCRPELGGAWEYGRVCGLKCFPLENV